MKKVICNVCGKKSAEVLQLSKSYGKGAELLVIENVPIISCPDCGESYLTAKTLREVENIKRNRSNFAVERNVPVAVFV
jgi:YgiT-type zinc finger domain-containing protein